MTSRQEQREKRLRIFLCRCARCQWTAESDGYDDDSKPLPVFKAKYKEFTEIIKAGSTSPWQHAA